jgi:hypothetical protein
MQVSPTVQIPTKLNSRYFEYLDLFFYLKPKKAPINAQVEF